MHLLQERIPFLFDTPTVADARAGILVSVGLAFSAVLWIAVSDVFGRGEYYLFPLVVLILHGYATFRLARNLLFLFRYALISIIGIGTSLAWSFKETILIAPFGATFQTHDATVALVGSILLAVSGSSIGWFAVFRRTLAFQPSSSLRIPSNLRIGRQFAMLLSFLIMSIIVYMLGGVVSRGYSYASGGNSIGFEFGAANAILLFCTSAFLILSRLLGYPARQILLILFIIFLFPILAGSRADFLMQLGIFALVLLRSDVVRQGKQLKLPFLKLALTTASLFFVASYIAVWRHIGDFGLAFVQFIDSFTFITERSAGLVLSLETANQMAGHFYAVYAKTSFLGEAFLMGSSYFDFLLRTPPQFLGLPRPQDLAWQMDVAGQMMAQGGIFEVAEAYWNFWFFGAFFVPFVISFLMGSLLRKALICSESWLFAAISFETIMLMSPRAIWYQTFAYYRTATTLVVIYFLVKFAADFFFSKARR